MEAKKEKKYMSDIHLEDYTEQYETGFATVDTMIFEGGRRDAIKQAEKAERISKNNNTEIIETPNKTTYSSNL